jgi:glycosyltransferase involved in cell wall biosynthesis
MALNTYGVELKRGELAEAAPQEAGLPLQGGRFNGHSNPFPGYAWVLLEVDAVLSASISEGAGLPAMEAAAAGRLVIGTPVGHFPRIAREGAGIVAPVEAEKFKAFVVATLRYYKDNPAAYRDKCRAIQDAAQKFDWQYSIGEWIELIETPRRGSG